MASGASKYCVDGPSGSVHNPYRWGKGSQRKAKRLAGPVRVRQATDEERKHFNMRKEK